MSSRFRSSRPVADLVTAFTVLISVGWAGITHGATVPVGFTESLVASGLANPTAMAFAPDGRLFVCEQAGRLRVIKDGVLLSTPFLTRSVDSSGERGLLGIAFDPDFAANQYVYIYYTATAPTIHNRVSRVVASGDVAVAGSEVVILDLDTLSSASNHNGGAIHFGSDGKLYVAVGDNANGANAQTLNNLHGKMLRINKDGTIPSDNPFYASAAGRNRAIWALGLRNPFTFAVQPITGAMFINDVGEGAWDEINDAAPGANYGWPQTEGATSDPRFTGPRYAYGHGSGGCAISGGAFYEPHFAQFPAEYVGDYFFADYCAGWIGKLDPVANTVQGFASGISSPVDLKVSADGAVHYLARGSGSTTGVVRRIDYGASAPNITSHPASQTARIGESVTFSVRASGTPPLGYQWQRNGADIGGATAADFTIGSLTQSDDGARFRAIVTNDFGSATSSEAVLTVTANEAPTATIVEPAQGTLYAAGDVITYAGSGTDPEDGTLPASAFTWQVDFHHDTHTHPFVQPTSGVTGGSFTIPTTGETSANVWYRIYLTVRDSEGMTHTIARDRLPRKSRITLTSDPAGLQLKLNGAPIGTPLSFDGVVGIIRSLDVVSPQTIDGTSWLFDSWSDGGVAAHDIATPVSDATYTATFVAAAAPLPVGHWDMDATSVSGATLSDRSGLGNNGAISGATIDPGKIGESLRFDGVDDRVDIPGASPLDTASGFTVAFWHLADENRGSIVAKPYGAGWFNSWQFEFDGAGLSFTSSDGVSQHFDAAAVPAAGAWVHIAGTWDGLTKRLFVNGVSVLAVPRSIAMDASDVVVGGDYNSGEFVLPFEGRVDELRVYGQALTDQQIRQLFEADSEPDTSAPSVPAGLTASVVSSSRIDLSWQAATDNVGVAGYHIFRDGVEIATTTASSYNDVGLDPATSYTYEVTAFDAAENESARSAAVMTATAAAPASTTIVEAHFDSGADGFAYLDDALRGTAQPGYASGVQSATEGFSRGALKVTLGGINDTTVTGMSGGWRRTFTLPATAAVTLSFRYKLTQSSEYESDELSEVIVRVNALQPGTGGADYVARIGGDGNGGGARTTGWQLFEVNLGTLGAGTHTLTIGGYNNKKTFNDEITEVLIDDLIVDSAGGEPPVLTSITVAPASATVPLGGTQTFTAQGHDQYGGPFPVTIAWTVDGGGNIDATGLFTASTAGGPFAVTAQDGAISGTGTVTVAASTTIVEAHFDSNADSFTYVDDAFRGTAQPSYASGVRSATEGFNGGGLKVTAGGIDDRTVNGMSGGWRRTFTLASAASVTLSFRYRLTQSSEYESDELSEVLVRVDALQPGVGAADYVARIAGNGNGGTARTTGWQLFEVNLGTLAAGTHTLTIGGHNNKKTFNDETTTVLVDDVVVAIVQ